MRDRIGHQDEEAEGGREPQEAAGVEPPQVDGPARLLLAEQDGGDQEPAQHEEDVDAQEAAHERMVVVGHDHEDGHGPKTVQGRTVARGLGRRGRRGETRGAQAAAGSAPVTML